MATITSIEGSPVHLVLGEALRPLLTNEMGSSIEVFDTSGPRDTGPPPHRHPWEEIYVVLDGQLEVLVEGETHTLTKGGLAHVPAGAEHAYRSLTEVHFLTIVSTGNAARFFAQLADEVEMSPPDIPGIVRVAAGHGVTITA
jgi:quercetin dioxygenase-like cupin family protein